MFHSVRVMVKLCDFGTCKEVTEQCKVWTHW